MAGNGKREDYLSWDEYFMAAAFLAAKRSKDPVTQVGACIVSPDRVIVGLGYNGMPKGCDDNEFPWGKDASSKLNSKYFYVCHAEANAILNKNIASLDGCSIYVALFPCNECAKFIIQAGISRVVFMSDKYAHKEETIAAKRMFNAAGVSLRQFTPSRRKIEIDFDEINSNVQAYSQLPATPLKPSTPVAQHVAKLQTPDDAEK